MIKKKTLVILSVIVIFGAFLRLYKLDKFPPSLFGDELDVGYQAYSILKTGRDYYGQKWPLSFHSISDWRTPLLLYATVPFVAVFGLTEWAVRLPPAIFGILTLPLFFLLVRKIFKKDNLALLSTFLLSISIWHLQYSRAAFEVSQMLLLLIAGIYFFLIGLERWKFLILSAVFLILTPYSYNTAKFFLPIIVLVLFFIYKSQILKISFKKIAVVLGVFIILGLPMAVDIFRGQGGQRFSILSIFTDPTTVPQIGFDRQTDGLVSNGGELKVGSSPALYSRVFHNKYVFWTLTLVRNYFRVFSTDFLFVYGDTNLRHAVQGGFGVFYWIDFILLPAGLLFLFFNFKDKNLRKMLALWFFLSPIPSVLTREGGTHATRLILMLPPAIIISSAGVYCLWLKFSKRKFLFSMILSLIFIVQFALYLHRYYIHYPLDSEEWWHFGYKQLAQAAKKYEKDYDYLVFSDADQPPLIYTLFWMKVDPSIAQKSIEPIWGQLSDAIWADHLLGTKYYFGHISTERMRGGGIEGCIKPNILYLAPQSEIRSDYRYTPIPSSIILKETIFYPSGRLSKYILTGK